MNLGDDPVLRRLDAFPYQKRVGDVMSRPLVTIGPDRPLAEAATLLSDRKISAVVVLDDGGRPRGILTERDLTRAVGIEGAGALSSPVGQVMSSPVATVGPDDFVYVAIGRLDRLGLRHLVAVDGDGRAVGMVTTRALLHQRAGTALVLGDEIEAATDGEGLAAARRRLPELAEGLLAEGLFALDVATVTSAVLRDLTRKATELAVAAMAVESWGTAPAAWAMLVLGSGGRGESLLGADQDNALVHLGGEAEDGWFAELGRRVADTLDHAGIPYCLGGVMAREPAWRHTLAGWEDVIRRWARAASPTDVLAADIFFDFAGVAGDAALADQLRSLAMSEVGASPLLIQHLASDLSRTQAPLRLLGGLRTEGGRVDVKLPGLLPVVGAARALALRHGIAATSTRQRLRALEQAGALPEADRELLEEAQRFLMELVLEQQVLDIRAGQAPGNKVEVGRLDRRRQRRLKQVLKEVEGFAQATGRGLV